MNIASLKAFCDLAETKSHAKAAQLNQITQRALGLQVLALERLFGSILVKTGKPSFRLTREGEMVYEHSRRILQYAQALNERLEELRTVISGPIHVATICSIGLYALPERLKRFLKVHPRVNVHVEYRRADQVYADVVSNVGDIGLVAYPCSGRQWEVVPLFKDPMILICHPEHPLAGAKRIRLTDLTGCRFIRFEPRIPTGQAIAMLLKTHGVRVQNIMEFDNIDTVKCAVETGAGVAIVPAETVRQEVHDGRLNAVEIAGEELVRPLAAILKHGRVVSPAMKEFIATLKQPCPAI